MGKDLKRYVVQDSDWDWDCKDGQGVFVLAKSKEDAAQQAAEIMLKQAHYDGAHLKVAEVNLVLFVEIDVVDGKVIQTDWIDPNK